MRYDPHSRRAFLQGTTAAFAIPFLQSLLPSSARAQAMARPPRMVCLFLGAGSSPQMWFPTTQLADFTTVAPEYKAARLKTLATKYGQVSPILSDPRFTANADLISLYRGLDGAVFSGHSKTGALSGHWVGDRTVDGTPANATIDHLVSRSPKVYPTAPNLRLLNLGVAHSTNNWSGPTASFSSSGSTVTAIPAVVNVVTAFDYVFQDFVAPGAGGAAALAELQLKRKSVLDLVLADYKAVSSSPRLAASEKQLLDLHVDRFRELEQKISAVRSATCAPPARPSTAGWFTSPTQLAAGAYHPRDLGKALDTMVDIVVSAFSCGLTRVATLMLEQSNHDLTPGVPGVIESNHGCSHARDNPARPEYRESLKVAHQFYFARVARLLEGLLAIDPGTGKRMIDDTLIVGVNEMGSWNHRTWSMPCYTISGLPQVNSGWYVDHRTPNVIPPSYVTDQADGMVENFGRDYNSFLIGCMTAMGLTPPDWEAPGVAGFGSYVFPKGSQWFSETSRQYGTITPGRRSAVPFMLK